MLCKREHIDRLDAADAVAGGGQVFEVAALRFHIAGDVDNAGGGALYERG